MSRMKQGRVIQMANGVIERCSHSVNDLEISMNTFHDSWSFLTLNITFVDLVLGKDWLDVRNPSIDWSHNSVCLSNAADEVHQLHGGSDEPSQTPLPSPSQGVGSRIVSALQVKRLARRGCQLFLMIPHEATDSGTDTLHTISDARPQVSRILEEFADVFPDDLPLGLPPDREIEHHIPLQPGATPPHRPPYRLSIAEEAELEKQLNDLLTHGYIRPSTSPFSSGVLFVRKADGTFRLCVDYRALNKLTIRNRYPLPRMDDLFDRLYKAKIFSKLDLRQGYHQVKVAEADIPKTAFVTRYGLYEWTVMPFGLTDAPATFMRVINSALRGLIDVCVIAYLDDILIFSKNECDHERDVRAVLHILRKNRLCAKLSKCVFFVDRVEFLGHVVGPGCLSTDPRKVAAVLDWPTPQSARDVRSFLGLATYFRRFIKHFSSIAAPLFPLLTAKHFHWLPQHEEAFNELKKLLTSAPVLRLPDPDRPFIVSADACAVGVGACLMQQDDDGRLHPIAYESHKLSPTECRWHTREQELLGILNAIRVWRIYLYAKPFTVISDHAWLQWLLNQHHLSPRQVRWLDFLAEYTFDITYQPGASAVMRVPDALSRRPDLLLTDSVSPTITADSVAAYSLTDVSFVVCDELHRRIRKGLKKDRYFRKILAALKEEDVEPAIKKDFRLAETGLLYMHDRICIPAPVRLDILHDAHDSPTAGHVGFDKTYARVREACYWPGLYKDVRQYVLSCDMCQRNRSNHLRSAGLLTPLPIPERPWQDVSMDFITKLPPSGTQLFDAIFVVVDRLTKMAHFMPFHEASSASETASVFFKSIYRLHGLPRSIVSDRDSKFTSRFWQTLMKSIGTRLNMSTAYHPQTDGQTERTNRTLEDLLRSYTCNQQACWSDMLAFVEFAYNDSIHSSTGFTPFFACYGYNPLTPARLLSDSPAIHDFTCSIDSVIHATREHIREAQLRQSAAANQHRRDVTFAVGDRVLLDAHNICFSTEGDRSLQSKKLQNRFLGPFTIIDKINEVAFRLKLPTGVRLHDVFHVSLLRPYLNPTEAFPDRTCPPPPRILADGDFAYEIQDILDKRVRKRNGKTANQYLVLWKGYPRSDATWEFESSLREDDCDEFIDQFEQARGRA